MPFQKMTIDDIPVIAPYFRFVTTNTCDFTVGGMFMWRDYFHMAWQVKDGVLYSTLTGEDGNLYYNLPLGEDIPAGLRQCLTHHPSGRCGSAPSRRRSCPCSGAAGRVEITEEENFADYLYSAEEMIQLSGKKFSGQRNHISRFLRTCQSWSFEPLDNTDAAEVETFFHTLNKKLNYTPGEAAEENHKVQEVLEHLDQYGLVGGVLRADGAHRGLHAWGGAAGHPVYPHREGGPGLPRRLSDAVPPVLHRLCRRSCVCEPGGGHGGSGPAEGQAGSAPGDAAEEVHRGGVVTVPLLRTKRLRRAAE